MARIVVLGGTGYAGTGIVTEAASRGHDVLSVSRTAPASLPEGAAHRAGAMTAQDAAQPSTPVLGTPFWHHA